jgi:hypothetical protein
MSFPLAFDPPLDLAAFEVLAQRLAHEHDLHDLHMWNLLWNRLHSESGEELSRAGGPTG